MSVASRPAVRAGRFAFPRGEVNLTFGAGQFTLASGRSGYIDVSSNRQTVRTNVDRSGSTTARVTVIQRDDPAPFIGGPSTTWACA